MPEIGTSGLMSGGGKRSGALRQYPRPSSTLPCRSISYSTALAAAAFLLAKLPEQYGNFSAASTSPAVTGFAAHGFFKGHVGAPRAQQVDVIRHDYEIIQPESG